MTSGLQSDRVRQTTLFGLFFLSGAAALIYQTAWHRLLGLFAGADTIAAALVVGAFLLGLGIGSLAAGLYADRLSRRAALIAFALCEVGIAVFAVISPWLYYDVVYREFLPLASSRGVTLRRRLRGPAVADVPDGLLAAVPLQGGGEPDRGLRAAHRLALRAEHAGRRHRRLRRRLVPDRLLGLRQGDLWRRQRRA